MLLHGLTNKHPWSEAFLGACVDAWGAGRVYLVYTNTRDSDRAVLRTRYVGGRSVLVGGVDRPSAGDRSIAAQSRYLDEIVRRLQQQRGLAARFSIIAHSMGGLVARDYVDSHPGTVTGLVTLGTPHHGSPLATDLRWTGRFMDANDAIRDLAPARCAAFNADHPVSSARLADGGRVFTIRGHADGADAFGAFGELRLGWALLSDLHHTASDGVVPEASALIEGASHLADFPSLDHYQLVRRPEVARKAAEALP